MCGDRTVNEVAAECGFSNQSYFSKVFSATYGIPPREYRHKENEANEGLIKTAEVKKGVKI